jgi:hypothetical protein
MEERLDPLFRKDFYLKRSVGQGEVCGGAGQGELGAGELKKRTLGTPQCGVISPLLANLFLHYAFDEWMKRNHPNIPFERYADES